MCIVMEYADSNSLEDKISAANKAGTKLKELEVQNILV